MTRWTDPTSPWMAVGSVEVDPDEPAAQWPRRRERTEPACGCEKCKRILARTLRQSDVYRERTEREIQAARMRAYRARKKAAA